MKKLESEDYTTGYLLDYDTSAIIIDWWQFIRADKKN